MLFRRCSAVAATLFLCKLLRCPRTSSGIRVPRLVVIILCRRLDPGPLTLRGAGSRDHVYGYHDALSVWNVSMYFKYVINISIGHFIRLHFLHNAQFHEGCLLSILHTSVLRHLFSTTNLVITPRDCFVIWDFTILNSKLRLVINHVIKAKKTWRISAKSQLSNLQIAWYFHKIISCPKMSITFGPSDISDPANPTPCNL